MADFFTNLILRSSPATKDTGSILQPRLPSLFESTLGGADELPTPQTDSALNPSFNPPNAFSAEAEARQPGEVMRPVADTITVTSSAAVDMKAPQKNPVSQNIPQRDTIQPTPRQHPDTPKTSGADQTPRQSQVETSRTVQAPPTPEPIFNAAPTIQAANAATRESGISSQPEQSPVNAPQVPGRQISPQVQINSADELRPSFEPTPSKAILQPMPLAKPASNVVQAQSTPQERSETVVQVHIGRIEVRAITPPAPAIQPAQTSRSQPKMSLDEYLRQREEKR